MVDGDPAPEDLDEEVDGPWKEGSGEDEESCRDLAGLGGVCRQRVVLQHLGRQPLVGLQVFGELRVYGHRAFDAGRQNVAELSEDGSKVCGALPLCCHG